MSKSRRVRLEELEVRRVLDSTVVFNELMYNPVGDGETLEWIEFYNQMAIDMDLSQWQIEGGVNYTFPDGTILAGGGHLVVAADPAALANATGFAGAIGPYVGQLNNSGEELRLVDRNERLLDLVNYRDEGDWPTGPDGSGASLAKLNPDGASGPAANWAASPQIGGTPGARNFPQAGAAPESQTLIASGGTWQFDASGTDRGTSWRQPGYVPVGWSTGDAVIYAGNAQVGNTTPTLITGVSAIGSTEYTADGRLAINTVNGSGLTGNLHSSATNTMWLTNGPTDTNPEITFDLGSVYSLTQIKVWNYNEFRPDLPTRVAELLGRGVKVANILVAGENMQFSPLMTHTFPVVTAATSGADFSDTISVPVTLARYIKFDIQSNYNGKDFNNPASDDTFGNYVGLSEVQFSGASDPKKTQAPLGPQTYYFRKEFAFAADPAHTQLFLNTAIDDGAVFYLNGVEVYRQNMPAGAPSYATAAAQPVVNAAFSGSIAIAAGSLVQGANNVLAVEVHQSSVVGDPDMVFGAELVAVVTPASPADLLSDLALNEIAAGGSPSFFVELVNHGAQSLNLSGYVVQSSSGLEHVIASGTLAAGGLLSLSAAALGFAPVVGDKLFLLNPARDLLADSIETKTTLRGRSTPGIGPWLYPDVATPGAANHFALHGEIVINEIMYNHQPDFATPGMPGTTSMTTVLPINATWKYNRTGANLGSNWYTTNYVVDNVNWRSGPGVIGVESSPLPAPILTTWTPYVSSIRTYYFQKEFVFDGAPAGAALQIRHLVDDGAIFYINGVEIPGTRFLMPAGAVDGTTLALSPGVNNAVYSNYIDVPLGMLNVGNNVISAEVHQFGANSADVVFGLELVLTGDVIPPVPPTPFQENPEEWVELYNRSAAPVNISGWQLDDAVQYTFPANTVIGAGQYLVVAANAAALAAEHPTINISGSYTGTLSDTDERLRLVDLSGNPADEVHYFESGRWPQYADGGGSSLELRDPDADNSSPEAWAASDEGANSTWKTYTYRGLAGTSAVGPDGQWNEFVLGLLDSGEVLLDDISVVQNPASSPVQLIQNGSFQSDTLGATANKWRIIGNERHSEVIVDPTDPANKVLRLVATGNTDHMSDHAETTLKNGATFVAINASSEYEISFKAKWISGSPQLNTRLYFDRLARTTIIEQSTHYGTPGAVNSRSVVNIGPTFTDFQHGPAVPAPLQPVTVSVTAADPDGVASMTLWYMVDGVGTWNSVPMTSQPGGQYSGQVPGQPASTIVQFYVVGQDALGETSAFPAAGAQSRALYKVNDSLAATNGLHNLRIVMLAADANYMHDNLNVMSNDRIGATVIYDEQEIFYDVGVRLKGSEHSRTVSQRLGFAVEFHAEQLFRGAHRTVNIDRSESVGFGQRELLSNQTIDHAGGILSKYNDLIQVITPRLEHTGSAELQMARYGQDFLDSQFENGSDGSLFEYELIYQLNSTNDGTPEGQKVPNPDSVIGTAIRDLGDDKEAYRWNFLVKNNADQDDFGKLIPFAKAMQLSGATFLAQIGNYIDVDQWLRGFAVSTVSGAGDNYGGDGSQHNVQFYVRPEDGKVLFFPHDLDAFYDANRPLVGNGDLSKLLAAPGNAHNYYGHVQDIIATTYNTNYMQHWAADFGQLLPAQPFASHLAFIGQRSAKLLADINAAAPNVAYNITSPDATVNSTSATIAGTGWVNVRTIRQAGSSQPLDITWNTVTSWQVSVPVAFGTHPVVLQAYDFQGNLIGTDTVNITSTISARPVQEFLRVSEVMYHPGNASPQEQAAGYTNSDEFEYVELVNTSASQTLALQNVEIGGGISFTFPAVSLLPGQRTLVVSNKPAFELRYGTALPVAGQYLGRLNNSGEDLSVLDTDHAVVQSFVYDDAWYATTDGDGPSLTIINATQSLPLWNQAAGWRPSSQSQGSPGIDDPHSSIVARQVFYNNSDFDGNSPLATPNDDLAIAASKSALLPGQTATFANYTSYSRGLNGLMIDIANRPAAALSASDFAFRVGNDNNVASWANAPAPSSIVVRASAGVNGSDRVELIWPDGAIINKWLQVAVLANANTGLVSADTFYFGDAIGESGTNPANAIVNSTDEIETRNNPKSFLNIALLTDRYDFNRDHFVNATDQILARSNATTLATALQLISVPASLAVAERPAIAFDRGAAAAALALPIARGAEPSRPGIALDGAVLLPALESPLGMDSQSSFLTQTAAAAGSDRSPTDPEAFESTALDEDLFELLATSQVKTAVH